MAASDNPLAWFVRHGTTVLNEAHIFRGNTDHPLDKKGFKDAHELAFYLEPEDICAVFSSDKTRAMQTAKIIADRKKMDFSPHPELRPWNIGEFGGLIKSTANKKALQYYVNNPSVIVPGGESLAEFRDRIRPPLLEAIQMGHDVGRPSLTIVHSSVLHELGEMLHEDPEAAHVKPGGAVCVHKEDGGLVVCPVFKPDKKATSQNVLGVVGKRYSVT